MTGIPQKQSIIETETLRIYTKIKFSKKIESVLVTTVKKKKKRGNRDLPGLISEETLLQV